MATVNAVVYEHHKRADGTYNVKIKIFHHKKRAHIETAHYVSAKQLNCDLQIKDKFILKILELTLQDYQRSISELGERLDFFDAEQLRDYLQDRVKIPKPLTTRLQNGMQVIPEHFDHLNYLIINCYFQ